MFRECAGVARWEQFEEAADVSFDNGTSGAPDSAATAGLGAGAAPHVQHRTSPAAVPAYGNPRGNRKRDCKTRKGRPMGIRGARYLPAGGGARQCRLRRQLEHRAVLRCAAEDGSDIKNVAAVDHHAYKRLDTIAAACKTMQEGSGP